MIDKEPEESKGGQLERLAGMFESAPVALTLADAHRPDLPLIVANGAFLRLTGHSRAEVLGRNCRFLQDGLDNETARAEARACISEGAARQMVFRNRRKTGEVFDNLLFLQPLVQRDGSLRYFLGSQFLLDPGVNGRRIDSHLAMVDRAVQQAIETHASLRAEQRRMFANAAHAVANAWLALL